jgi:hypothetical protein
MNRRRERRVSQVNPDVPPLTIGNHGSKTRPPGCIVICRYKDHVLFKDGDASQYQPWTREAIGWLEYEDEEYVRLVWERFSQANLPANARTRSTGLTILKSAILEIRKLG